MNLVQLNTCLAMSSETVTRIAVSPLRRPAVRGSATPWNGISTKSSIGQPTFQPSRGHSVFSEERAEPSWNLLALKWRYHVHPGILPSPPGRLPQTCTANPATVIARLSHLRRISKGPRATTCPNSSRTGGKTTCADYSRVLASVGDNTIRNRIPRQAAAPLSPSSPQDCTATPGHKKSAGKPQELCRRSGFDSVDPAEPMVRDPCRLDLCSYFRSDILRAQRATSSSSTNAAKVSRRL